MRHGGYWRSGSKDDNCNFVPTFTERGATVVLVEYDLCPNVTVTDIVRQTRSAIAWTYKNVLRYGGDPTKLFVSGHSAGGHLTAMALAHDWQKDGLPQDLIKGAAATSGVYDLEMVMKISVQEEVRMMIRQAGIDPDKEIKILALGSDAARLTAPADTQMETQGYRILARAYELFSFPYLGLGTHTRKIKEKPAEIRRVIKATIRANRFIRDNRDKAVRTLIARGKVEREFAYASMTRSEIFSMPMAPCRKMA